MNKIYFITHSSEDIKNKLYLCRIDTKVYHEGGNERFIRLMNPIDERNEIESIIHCTSMENAQSWLKIIQEDNHPEVYYDDMGDVKDLCIVEYCLNLTHLPQNNEDACNCVPCVNSAFKE